MPQAVDLTQLYRFCKAWKLCRYEAPAGEEWEVEAWFKQPGTLLDNRPRQEFGFIKCGRERTLGDALARCLSLAVQRLQAKRF